jgi:hypothetical protein
LASNLSDDDVLYWFPERGLQIFTQNAKLLDCLAAFASAHIAAKAQYAMPL